MDSPGFTELLVRRESAVIMIAVWIVLDLLYRILPMAVRDAKLTVRLAPLYPLILCQIAVWLPGRFEDVTTWSERIMIGLILGWASAHFYKVWMQGVLGRDRRVNRRASWLKDDEDEKDQIDPGDNSQQFRQSQIPTKDLSS